MTYTLNYLQKNPQEAKRLLGVNYDNLMQLIELAKSLDNWTVESSLKVESCWKKNIPRKKWGNGAYWLKIHLFTS